MLYRLWGLYLVIFDQIYEFTSSTHEFVWEIFNPFGDCCRKQQFLGLSGTIFINELENHLHIFLETLLKHLIGLI